MFVKRALLKTEKDNIIQFLNSMDLFWDEDIVDTYYIEINNEVIATGSRSDKVIKCLAVKKEWQSHKLISLIIDVITESFFKEGIYHYFVVTRRKNEEIFKSLGFKEIIKNDLIIFMEKGISSINLKLTALKEGLERELKIDLDKLNIGAIILNANPVTNGHLKLIEYASKYHDLLLLFLVEEEKSWLTYIERTSLLFISTQHLGNIKILPSTEYLVSSATFPNYFLKDNVSRYEYMEMVDPLIFKKYFMPIFNIKKRYIGTEIKPYMVSYNNALVKALDGKIEVIKRYEDNGVIISSSHVRELIYSDGVDAVLKYIPKQAQTLFKNIVRSKIDG